MTSKLQLFDYWRSSAAYRVRIALGLKGLDYETTNIDLLKDAQTSDTFLKQNPQGRVPFLQDGDYGFGQSLAIIEYLDEIHPQPPLLPGDSRNRAKIRAFASTIACDIHPLNNLTVLKYLKRNFGQPQTAIDDWIRHWIYNGFAALESMAQGPFVFGDSPTLADICLVPQMYNARRFNSDLGPFPKLAAADAHARAHPAFVAAAPENHPARA